MKNALLSLTFLILLTGCKKELAFEEQTFEKKTTLPCKDNCPSIDIKIPIAKNIPIVADSINKKVFSVLKEIIYFGENPYPATSIQGLADAFMGSYEKLRTDFPEDAFGWEGKIEGTVKYQSDSILNIEIKHYTFTGGAHGYSGLRSLIFNPETGKSIANDQLFKNIDEFKAFAEKKFREKYKIPQNAPINSTGLMFENDDFQLPQTYFYTDNGFLLYYNVYETASYADGSKEILFSYEEMEPYLITK